jgi:hypothetical protein
MCLMEDIYELRDRPQNENPKKRAPEGLLKEQSIGITENVCLDEECIFEKSRDSKEIDTIPTKITILNAKKERILKAEEDPRKPWYFTHV